MIGADDPLASFSRLTVTAKSRQKFMFVSGRSIGGIWDEAIISNRLAKWRLLTRADILALAGPAFGGGLER